MTTWPVDPLQRTCTEVLMEDDPTGARRRENTAQPQVISVSELVQVPSFVLLGEPGMGKSETMKALATLATGSADACVTADHFIVRRIEQHATHPTVFIDALDEARASGDNGVWRALRTRIAQTRLQRFGIACRVADWMTTDAQDIQAVAPGRSLRIFSLDPLSPEQARAVLEHEEVQDIKGFEETALALGFGDMLRNPQSLKMLAAAVKGNSHQWPSSRCEAYEMACRQLVSEPNTRHQQASVLGPAQGHETLLQAAGWLCALQLLSNASDIVETDMSTHAATSVRLTDVLDSLPTTSFSDIAVHQALHRRVFAKPKGYAASHRTIAEFLAARYIAARVAEKNLSPGRVLALIQTSPQHLVSNLRGLAGWLAVLSDPLGRSLFEVDPWAVLDYGDLSLLKALPKQLLIERLEQTPNPYESQGRWHRAASHTPLVEPEMFDFVSQWLQRHSHQSDAPVHVFQLADALLDALAVLPKTPNWTPLLDTLVRDAGVSEGIRESALKALHRHAINSATLLSLLNALHSDEIPDALGRLTEYLLSCLYPNVLPPSEVMRYFKATPQTGRFISFPWFWGHQIAELTPDGKLLELMDSVSSHIEVGKFADAEFRATGEELKGLATLVVRAIKAFGTAAPIAKLAEWVRWCTDHDARFLHPIDQENGSDLQQWLQDHPEKVKAILAHRVAMGMESWPAQYYIPGVAQPKDLGSFWLSQAKLWDQKENLARASDCMDTAIWWVFNHDGGGITLQDLEEAAAGSNILQSTLAPRLVSSLSEDNRRRKHWLSDEKYRTREAERRAWNERNLRYLLEHLDEVRSGKLFSYLGEAAWHDMSSHGYSELRNSALYAQWRDQHPELEAATQEGYVSLLLGLTVQDGMRVIDAHKASGLLHLELPCLFAAHKLFAKNQSTIEELGTKRLQALTTICLFSHGNAPSWFKYLSEQQPAWVEEIWWSLCQSALRSKTEIRILQFGWLRRQQGLKTIARSLLPRLLEAWPSKFAESSYLAFAQLLEVCILELEHPSEDLSNIITTRLHRKALDSLQMAYLVMAGLWVDPNTFAPLLEQMLRKKHLINIELLGFVGHLNRYGDHLDNLPPWSIDVLGFLFRLFGPMCPASRPEDSIGSRNDDGREFLHKLLSRLREDTSPQSQQMLQQLLVDPQLREWHRTIEATLRRQIQYQAEKMFAVPTARQVALTLQNKAPANPADLMSAALDALGALQQTLRNSDTNRLNRLWTVDTAGKRAQPPHRPEPECRNAIAEWLRADLASMDISVAIENQHGAQNQSDIVLRVRTAAHEDMLLPIEIKGDWNRDLWTAASEQLAKQYASEPRCYAQGIYLVLWLGKTRGKASKPKVHPNHPTHTPADLQMRMQSEVDQKTVGQNIKVFVLDVSIPD